MDDKAVVRRLVDEFLNTAGDWANTGDLFHPELIHHIDAPGLPPGLPGFKRFSSSVFLAFPDWHVEVEKILADAGLVMIRTLVTATHLGPFMGHPATGKRVSFVQHHLFRVQDGKIAEVWPMTDLPSLLNQIANKEGLP